jgi:hypothetical protein
MPLRRRIVRDGSDVKSATADTGPQVHVEAATGLACFSPDLLGLGVDRTQTLLTLLRVVLVDRITQQ